MQRCYFCRKELHEVPFTCRRCGSSFCADHHLPENHNCTQQDKAHFGRCYHCKRQLRGISYRCGECGKYFCLACKNPEKHGCKESTSIPPATYIPKREKPYIPPYNRPIKHYRLKRFLRKLGRGIKTVIIAGVFILIIGFFAIMAFSSLFSNYSIFMSTHNPVADVLKPALSLPTETTINKSKENLGYVNSIRTSYGKSPLSFDLRLYNLAKARTSDMEQYAYFDHVNPTTGTCAYSMKSAFGFNSNEYVAENAYESQISINYGPPQLQAYHDGIEKDAVDSWLTDRGHKYNLLYSNHISGAVYCSQNSICVFLGLNHDMFTNACHTAAEGNAFWNQARQQPGEV